MTVLCISLLGCPSRESNKQVAQGACAISSTGEVADRELAQCLAEVASSRATPPSSIRAPVVLFIDRSKSMRGFLDPAYPTRMPTDYRSVIDKLVVGLRPEAGFSFGSQVRGIEPTLGTLGASEFYSDRDTQMEQVFDQVARDTTIARTFIIVGDGRRGSPQLADGQFARMRSLAERWVDKGGSFMVGVSLAPFKTVAEDPSGCRTDRADDPRQTCPLFAFAFVARGAEGQIGAALTQVFEHLFAWPIAAINGDDLTLTATETRSDVRFERKWQRAKDGSPVVRSRGPVAVQRWLSISVQMNDTVDVYARAKQALLNGQRITLRVHSRRFAPEAAKSVWQAVERTTLLRASPDRALAFDLITRGEQAPPTIYRVDLVPSGIPNWLESIDATNADDRVRTYGVGRLFETFRQRAALQATADSSAVARFFVVAN